MPIPSYGAAPLSKTFLVTRALQVVAMIAIVGLTANFVNNIVTTGKEAPQEIVGTLSITCLATLYCAISVAFFWSQANLGLFVMTGVDSLLLIAFIVCAVTVGKPLSYLNCYLIGDATPEISAQSAWAFTMSITSNLNQNGSKLDLSSWAGATKANCLETKAIWGLCIALCILFTTSAVLLPTCWYKNRKVGGFAKHHEDA